MRLSFFSVGPRAPARGIRCGRGRAASSLSIGAHAHSLRVAWPGCRRRNERAECLNVWRDGRTPDWIGPRLALGLVGGTHAGRVNTLHGQHAQSAPNAFGTAGNRRNGASLLPLLSQRAFPVPCQAVLCAPWQDLLPERAHAWPVRQSLPPSVPTHLQSTTTTTEQHGCTHVLGMRFAEAFARR
eukprot:COSAG02_NODE_3379_length_6839_cov_2.979970_3_plen_184_part_00